MPGAGVHEDEAMQSLVAEAASTPLPAPFAGVQKGVGLQERGEGPPDRAEGARGGCAAREKAAWKCSKEKQFAEAQ